MTQIYSEEFNVRINEVNHKNHTKLVNIFDWFQHVSSSHSFRAGFPLTDLLKKKLTWVVTRYRINIEKYPKWLDQIKVSTWRSSEIKNYAPREFIVENKNNEVIIKATSSFKLIDLKTKRPVSPKEHIPLYPIFEKRIIQDEFLPLEEPKKEDYRKEFNVRRQNLDINGHVNNTVYIEWALETVPDSIFNNYSVYDLEIAFLKETFYEDKIICIVEQKDNLGFLHKIKRVQDNATIALLSTKWR